MVALVAAAKPCVTAPISERDATQIQQLIRATTRDPIICIFCVSTDERVPGSVTGFEYQYDVKKGTRKDRYTRTDCVSVHTGYLSRGTGDAYEVQKVSGKWKITAKGFWDIATD
jgi:hypothetical protein